MVKYTCILADPPWPYRNKKTGGSMKSGARQHYDVMSTGELIDLGIAVRDAADRDCVLFLWATTPMLPEALELMQAWGFKYKTTIYWRKIMSLGMGFWFRGQVELLLVGVRGKVKAFRCQRPNIIQSKVRRHSQKPEESYQMIEAVCPGPRLELFARNLREGWDCWGDEVETSIVFGSKEEMGGHSEDEALGDVPGDQAPGEAQP